MFGLTDDALDKIRACLAEQPEIHWAKIYGSRAIGTYHRGSDIDLAISSDENNAAHWLALLDALPLPYLFDVTHYETLSHEGLKAHIDRVGQFIVPS